MLSQRYRVSVFSMAFGRNKSRWLLKIEGALKAFFNGLTAKGGPVYDRDN